MSMFVIKGNNARKILYLPYYDKNCSCSLKLSVEKICTQLACIKKSRFNKSPQSFSANESCLFLEA